MRRVTCPAEKDLAKEERGRALPEVNTEEGMLAVTLKGDQRMTAIYEPEDDASHA